MSNIVVRVGTIEMGPGSRISAGNLLKDLRLVRIGSGASIGRLNTISSNRRFSRHLATGGRLVLESRAFITATHSLDCSGGILIGELACIAGHQTKILTHSIDLERNVQAARAVEIGSRSFVGARCLLLAGARLPERSVLAAGSVLPMSRSSRDAGLWAGAPAIRRGEVTGRWFDRTEKDTRSLFDPESGQFLD